MKYALVIVAILAFFTQTAFAMVSTGENSDSLSVVIVGKWADKMENFVLSVSSVTQYFADGTVKMDATASMFGKKLKLEVKGFWRIVGRRLTMTAAQSSYPRLFPPGTVTNDEIVSISSTQMILVGEDGKRSVSEHIEP